MTGSAEPAARRSVFDLALDFTLSWEGGLSLDPRDRGGATNYGVSLRFLHDLPVDQTDFDHDGRLTWRDVAAMTREQARSIYLTCFWDRLALDDAPARLAVGLFDTAVNCGRTRAARWLQIAFNSLHPLLKGVPRLVEDGRIGPRTHAAVQSLAGAPGVRDRILHEVLTSRRSHYDNLKSSPDHAWAYTGWINRLEALRVRLAAL